ASLILKRGCAMPFALNFYHDQIAADGAASALAAERRLLYVRHGRVTLNGEALKAGESRFCDGALEMRSAGEWSQIWRWDLAPPIAISIPARAFAASSKEPSTCSKPPNPRAISCRAMRGGRRAPTR